MRGSHHGGVSIVGVGVWRDHQKGDPTPPVESENFDRVDNLQPVAIESYRTVADDESARVLVHASIRYNTRSIPPSLTESTANRSGNSAARSSECGHHAPSTLPLRGALGFNRNRGVLAGTAEF